MPDHRSGTDDPRMRGFRLRTTVEDVLALIRSEVRPLGAETVPLSGASGRVLASAVTAACDVPPFDRAAMDGYALLGEETFGASAYSPAAFRLVGVSRPGRAPGGRVGPGEAVEIATGAPLPDGADTVVKVETTERTGTTVLVGEPTPPGRHISRQGEDVAAGTLVFPVGRRLRPQDLGVLSSLGVSAPTVVRRPRVALLVTGDELLAPGATAEGWRIADANSVMLAALVARDGGSSLTLGPVRDEREEISRELERACGAADAVLVSGGTSTGPEDHAPEVLAGLGRLSVHGVALRPASPTGLGFVGNVPVVLLPGNPVSCLCGYDFFAGRIVRRLAGLSESWPYPAAAYPLGRKLSSVIGRVDYARVRLDRGLVEPLAVGGASALSSTSRADGFVIVPADLEGYPAGALVTVWHYDPLPGDPWGG